MTPLWCDHPVHRNWARVRFNTFGAIFHTVAFAVFKKLDNPRMFKARGIFRFELDGNVPSTALDPYPCSEAIQCLIGKAGNCKKSYSCLIKHETRLYCLPVKSVTILSFIYLFFFLISLFCLGLSIGRRYFPQNCTRTYLPDLENFTFPILIIYAITHPSVHHFSKKSTQFCSNWLCVIYSNVHMHPICVIWAVSPLMKNPHRRTKFC